MTLRNWGCYATDFCSSFSLRDFRHVAATKAQFEAETQFCLREKNSYMHQWRIYANWCT